MFIEKFEEINSTSTDKHLTFNGQVIEYDQPYIAQKNTLSYFKLLKVIQSKYSFNIVAPMGSGKTFGIIQILTEEAIPAIVAVPYYINVLQLKEDLFKVGIKIGYIFGQSPTKEEENISEEDISAMIADPEIKIIVCVYNSVYKLFQQPAFFSNEYTLVVDEAHNLVTQYDFRNKAIITLSHYFDKFKRNIMITGTPEGALFNNFYTVIFKKVRSILYPNNSSMTKLEIVKYIDDGKNKLLKHLLSRNHTGKVVILLNNKKVIANMIKMLLQNGIAENTVGEFLNENINFISSEKKKSEEFIHIINHNLIPANIKFLFTTSVISDGVNILNDDIDAVYMFDIEDFWLKRQFISRFRSGINVVYDFMSFATEKNVFWFNPYKEFENLKSYYCQIADTMTDLSQNLKSLCNASGVAFSQNNFDQQFKSTLYYDELSKQYKVSYQSIGNTIIKALNKIMVSNSDKAKEFYTYIGKCTVSVTNFSELSEINKVVVPIKLDKKESFQFSTDEVFKFISDNFEAVLAHFLIKNPTYIKKLSLFTTLVKGDSYRPKHIQNKIERIYNDTTNSNFKKALEFALAGFPKEIILLVIRMLFDRRFKEVASLGIMLQQNCNRNIIEKTPIIKNYLLDFKELNGLFKTSILMENMKIGQVITPKETKNSINKILISNGIKKFNDTEFYASLDGLYLRSDRKVLKVKSSKSSRKSVGRYILIKTQSLNDILNKYSYEGENLCLETESITYSMLTNLLNEIKCNHNTPKDHPLFHIYF